MEKKNNVIFIRMVKEIIPKKERPKADIVDQILLENPFFFL